MDINDITEKKTVDMLTSDSVSILTQKFITIDGVVSQVGENHRRAYENSESGRKLLQEGEPQEVVNSVLSIWGDTPTITYPEVPDGYQIPDITENQI